MTDLLVHQIERVDDVLEYTRRSFGDELIGQPLHGISTEDGLIVVPFHMDGGTPTARRGLVHDVVVEQGEVVVHLDSKGWFQSCLDVIVVEAGCNEHEGGTQTLASRIKGVPDGVVESGCGNGVVEVLKPLFDHFTEIS